MGHHVPLGTTLFAIVLMSATYVLMAADHASPPPTAQQLSPERTWQPMWSTLVESPVSLGGDLDLAGQRTHHEPDLADDENAAPSALGQDWRGLGRDTAFFLGYQGVVAGILYLLPESETQWTAEQKRTSMRRWWENVQHPTWDEDTWYVNYLGHPYFGAIAYTRARERRLGAFGAFWYAALLSGLYEFGIEALFEQPSYQDLIVTPMAGALLGALLFEPIREHIQGKPERQWYDHVTLALTDPLGTANSMFERLLGIQTEVWVRVQAPALAPHAPLNGHTDGPLNRPQGQHYRFYGVGVAFVF
jgi:hypothetical protein